MSRAKPALSALIGVAIYATAYALSLLGLARQPGFSAVEPLFVLAVLGIAMPLLAWAFGLMGLAAATLIGVTVTGAMLLHHNGLWPRVQLSRLVLVSAVPLVLGWLSLGHLPTAPLFRLGVSTVAGVLCLGLVAAVLRPWRPATSR